jgi:caudovirus prohead protease
MKTTTIDLNCRFTENEAESRTFTAIGVPWNSVYDTGWGYRERFAPDSVDATGAVLVYQHREPIGTIIATRSTDAGLEIDARISNTPRGDEVYTLLRDGVLRSMSIGFEPIDVREEMLDGEPIATITRARAVEFSVVLNPAYKDASITEVRSQEGTNPMTQSTVDIDALRADVDHLTRAVNLINTPEPAAPIADTRSAGDFLKALATGDEATRAALSPFMARNYDGGVSGDDKRTETPVFIRDLTRIIDNANPIAKLFATGALPATGMSVEFAELDTNTVRVGKQETEGADLHRGKVSVKTRTAAIETFGGAATLSFQEIQRSTSPMVALHLKAMAIDAGRTAADSFHAFYDKTVSTSTATPIAIKKAATEIKWADLLAMIVDASHAYQELSLSLDGLIVDRATFLALGSLTDTANRPLLTVTGSGMNTVGSLNTAALTEEIGPLKIVPDFSATTEMTAKKIVGTFFNSEALRTYTSGLAHLQDDNIINLSRDMSVYYYAAHAAEIPSALIPFKVGA